MNDLILERKPKIRLEDLKIEDRLADFSIYDVKEMTGQFQGLVEMQQTYTAAIREVSTKLEILDDEFHIKYDHNPIHHMEYRLKQIPSIFEKLKEKGLEISLESAEEHLNDIAGIRVICHYINDVYDISKLILKQKDITLIKKIDYIKNPKPNGYRSLHIVVSVPVFLSEETKNVKVEIQIRTIAMDFWASLEHQLRYKADCEVREGLQKELTECAESISVIDQRMQSVYTKLYLKDKMKNSKSDENC